MRNFISPRDVFIDKAFFQCTVKLLEWRNTQQKDYFFFEELAPHGGLRTESVLIELEVRGLVRRYPDKRIWIQREEINRDYLDGARSFLREWENEGLSLNVKLGLGIAGFILSLFSTLNSIFHWVTLAQ